MATSGYKTLLVEGSDDCHAIVNLMSAYIPWGRTESEWPVKVKRCGSVDTLLDKHSIPLELKSNEARILGVVIDSNDEFEARWGKIRARCVSVFPNCPPQLPESGLVISNIEGQRFGAWVMPDNTSRGMLETFLLHLVPPEQAGLRQYADAAVSQAQARGAPFRDAHREKALIHTWLAWHDPPGRPFGQALAAKALDPGSINARPFVDWFRELFKI